MTRIVIIGAAGRMGRALVRAAAESSDLNVVGAVASPASPVLGQDAGDLAGVSAVGIRVTDDLAAALAQADVAIDFSNALATQTNLAACRRARKPLVIGTTGFAADLADEFETAAAEIPLLVAPNTSVGVTLLIELVRVAARALPANFDVEIIEAHHRMKRDAPSGTALALGRAAAEGRSEAGDGSSGDPDPAALGDVRRSKVAGDAAGDDAALGEPTSRTRVGGSRGPRRDGEIGFAVVRGGDIVGDHTVLFAGMGERLVLSHQATDRTIFARGALQAAAWLAPKPAGRYFMRDIVIFKSEG